MYHMAGAFVSSPTRKTICELIWRYNCTENIALIRPALRCYAPSKQRPKAPYGMLFRSTLAGIGCFRLSRTRISHPMTHQYWDHGRPPAMRASRLLKKTLRLRKTWSIQRLQIMYLIWRSRLMVHPSSKVDVAMPLEPRGEKAWRGPEDHWTWYHSMTWRTTQHPVLNRNRAFLRHPSPQSKSSMIIFSIHHHKVCCLRPVFLSLTHSGSAVAQHNQPVRPDPADQALSGNVRTSQQPLEIAPPTHPPPQNQQIHPSPTSVWNPSITPQILPPSAKVASESPPTK